MIFAASGLGAASLVLRRHVKRCRQTLQEARQQQALEHERARIARDLHDDLGAAVTQIKLLGELVERDANEPRQTAQHGQQIVRTSRDLARHMDELVWVVNPQKDHLENLVSYLTAYSEELLGATEIRYRLDFPDDLPNVPVSGQVRHRLFLAFREALNNVIKHAQATEVGVHLRVKSGRLLLSVEDNGQGFEARDGSVRRTSGLGGNGLANLHARLAEANGSCQVESQPGGGTRVRMSVSLN